jgi:hypothetical protein
VLAERIDQHRKDRQRENAGLTLTDMYNVLAKLRTGTALSAKERVLNEHGLVSLLRSLHDELDAAVFDAYGWRPDLTDEQILQKLVAINEERSEEERRGVVRWLRPGFQNPVAAAHVVEAADELGGDEAPNEEGARIVALPMAAWPKSFPEQIAAVRDIIWTRRTPSTLGGVAHSFRGAKPAEVEPILDGLVALGMVLRFDLDGERRWTSALGNPS